MVTREYEIYQFIKKNGDKARISEVCAALGRDRKMKQEVKDTISLMRHYGLVTINDDSVAIAE